jgi:hypothetical protein
MCHVLIGPLSDSVVINSPNAIKDHNEIRDGIRDAGGHRIGDAPSRA